MNIGVHYIRSARAYNRAVEIAEKAQKCVLRDFDPGVLDGFKDVKNLKRKGNFIVKCLDFLSNTRKKINVNPSYTEGQVIRTKDENIIFRLFRSRNFNPDEGTKVVMNTSNNQITEFVRSVGNTKKTMRFDENGKLYREEFTSLYDEPLKTITYENGHKKVFNARIQL